MDPDAPVFSISVAAALAEMHPQTLRTYDRLGLVVPSRAKGGGRRYSPRDVYRLRLIQRLSQEEITETYFRFSFPRVPANPQGYPLAIISEGEQKGVWAVRMDVQGG